MILNIVKINQDKKSKIPDLITRPLGRELYERVKKSLENIQTGEVVVIDFEGIRVIDPSFIDEFIIKLVLDSRMESPPFHIKLINISDIAIMNITSVFKSYNSFNNVRLAVIIDRVINNSYFIGELNTSEKDIINYLVINKSAVTQDIISFLDTSLSDTISILENLFNMRLVRKERHDSIDYYFPL